MRVIGLISGTSMDGIDVAAADMELRNEDIELRPLGAMSVAYDAGLRRDVEAALPPATTTAETLCRLDNDVGRAFAAAARRSLHELAPGADLVVSHGQTLYHWVDEERVLGTLQIGQPAWIAATTGLPVVADLRAADVAAGGQGAPLASLFDLLLLSGSDHIRAALNIGGIANLTVVDPTAEPIAFDTGPGNALIDVAVRHLTDGKQPFDQGGAIARRGTVQRLLLDRLLADSYYRRPSPKSTGKEHFHLPYLLEAVADTGEIEPDDVVATVTALTATTIADACRAHEVKELIVSGGGAHNPFLMEMLADLVPDVVIRPIDDLGIPSSAKEAYLIALIGFLTVHGLAGNLPSATGATRPVVLGCLLPGRKALTLPPPATVAPARLHVLPSQKG
jgi:anhydro-N-acetylmuramic acid kinase